MGGEYSVSLDKEKHIVFLKSGNRCAFPGCNNILTEANQVAHIRSKKIDGPRHVPNWNNGNFDVEENLICLCPTHHMLIDSDVYKYSINSLVSMKIEHELYVKNIMEGNAPKNRKFFNNVSKLVCKYNMVKCIGSFDPTVPTREPYLEYMSYFCIELSELLEKNYINKISIDLLNDWSDFNNTLEAYMYYLIPFIQYVPDGPNSGVYINTNPNESREEIQCYRNRLMQCLRKYSGSNL